MSRIYFRIVRKQLQGNTLQCGEPILSGMETNDNGQTIVNEAIKKNKEGYIITLMWHQGRPTDNPPFGWKESIQGKLTDAEWQAAYYTQY